MAETVYVLCAVTSIVCAVLLLRGYLRGRTRLLFWSALCFAGLALNNILLFVDLVIVPELDLSLPRTLAALAGMIALLALAGREQVSHTSLQTFLWGALAMACFVAGLYFLRFWRSTRDRFFVFFLLAFWVLSLQWTLLALTVDNDEERLAHYAMRLVAFGLIIAGVVDKNRRGR